MLYRETGCETGGTQAAAGSDYDRQITEGLDQDRRSKHGNLWMLVL
ncbi:hypothetical protein [Butyrivibrio sp. WCD3002]|nr:hypothetical protein [Butyrivibrio sp. WCD3002]